MSECCDICKLFFPYRDRLYHLYDTHLCYPYGHIDNSSNWICRKCSWEQLKSDPRTISCSDEFVIQRSENGQV